MEVDFDFDFDFDGLNRLELAELMSLLE